jgi:hypothetical protein
MGAYNTIRWYKVWSIQISQSGNAIWKELISKRLVLPPLKFVITGTGKVGGGIKEILDAMKIKEFLLKTYLTKTTRNLFILKLTCWIIIKE